MSHNSPPLLKRDPKTSHSNLECKGRLRTPDTSLKAILLYSKALGRILHWYFISVPFKSSVQRGFLDQEEVHLTVLKLLHKLLHQYIKKFYPWNVRRGLGGARFLEDMKRSQQDCTERGLKSWTPALQTPGCVIKNAHLYKWLFIAPKINLAILLGRCPTGMRKGFW